MTRDASKANFPRSVKVVQSDYSSVEALAPVLKGHDAVVDLLNRNAWEASILIIDAAIAAGVKFLIPSSWGIDMRNEFLAKLPPLIGKKKMEDHLHTRGAAGDISYAIINTAFLMDWVLANSIMLPLAGGTMYVFDGGDVKMSGTLLDDVGKATVNAIKKREDPAVKNRILFVHSALCSLNIFLKAARAADRNKKWDVVDVSADELIAKSWAAYNEGKRDVATMRGFIGPAAYGKGLAEFKHVDNDLLGVKALSEKELDEIIAYYVNNGKDGKYPYYRD